MVEIVNFGLPPLLERYLTLSSRKYFLFVSAKSEYTSTSKKKLFVKRKYHIVKLMILY